VVHTGVPRGGGSIWRVPEESDPRQLALARRLLRLEAYLVPAGVGLLVGTAIGLALVLPFVPLFLVPFAALILLLHPVSRAAALPLGGQPAGVGR
jgi:hypothetical protein